MYEIGQYKNEIITSSDKESPRHSHTLVVEEIGTAHWALSMKALKMLTSCDLTIPFLGISLRGKTSVSTKIFIITLYIIVTN